MNKQSKNKENNLNQRRRKQTLNNTRFLTIGSYLTNLSFQVVFLGFFIVTYSNPVPAILTNRIANLVTFLATINQLPT